MVSLSLVTVITVVLFLNKNNEKHYHYASYLLIFGCSLLGLYWIHNSLYVIGGLPFLLSVFSTGLLAFYVAAFYIVALVVSRIYAFSSLEVAAMITGQLSSQRLLGLRKRIFYLQRVQLCKMLRRKMQATQLKKQKAEMASLQ